MLFSMNRTLLFMNVIFAKAVGKNVTNASHQHINIILSNTLRNWKDRQGGHTRRSALLLHLQVKY